MRRILFLLFIGLAGLAVLVALGVWQLQRLAWKRALLDEIAVRIAAEPVALPTAPDADTDRYLAVHVQGDLEGAEIHVLVSVRQVGAGYRIIAPLVTQGRRIMVDRGFVPVSDKALTRPGGPVGITGNLHWPDEVDRFTPPPDVEANIWFARDVARLAEALDTEPVLVVARTRTDPGVTPMPVGTDGIPDNHLNYALTWFGLAAVWAGMTLFFLWRTRARSES